MFRVAWCKKQGSKNCENPVIWRSNFEFLSFSFYTHENDENNNNYTFSHSHTYR